MYLRKRKGASLYDVMSYTLPKLHTGKNWYVDFTCYDPVEQEMRRKKYMLDKIPKLTDRKRRAAEIITNVTKRLHEGWNPWAEASSSRQYTLFTQVIEYYTKYIEKLYKAKAIKESTYLDYNKRIRILKAYNENHATGIMYVYQFNLSYASDFLDYILLDRDTSARTRNNYRIWLSSFCNWMIEKEYLEANPIEKIRSLPENQKFRTAISALDLQRLLIYLEEKNPYYLLLCQFAYYTFIRPEEITNIRLRDLFIKEQKVFIPSAISKNRRDGMVGLNDILIRQMVELGVFKHTADEYLFGPDFKPSKKKASTRIYRNYFYKVRDALRMPTTYHFYSLKDSGIRDLANAKGIVIARDQARHADISTTNKYLTGKDLTVHEETKHFKGNL